MQGRGLPLEICWAIVALSQTMEDFQEAVTSPNNNNNAPPPAAGILEKNSCCRYRPRKKQGQALQRFNLRCAPAARGPRTSTHASFERGGRSLWEPGGTRLSLQPPRAEHTRPSSRRLSRESGAGPQSPGAVSGPHFGCLLPRASGGLNQSPTKHTEMRGSVRRT